MRLIRTTSKVWQQVLTSFCQSSFRINLFCLCVLEKWLFITFAPFSFRSVSLTFKLNRPSCIFLPFPQLMRRIQFSKIDRLFHNGLLNFLFLYLRAIKAIPVLIFLEKYRCNFTCIERLSLSLGIFALS